MFVPLQSTKPAAGDPSAASLAGLLRRDLRRYLSQPFIWLILALFTLLFMLSIHSLSSTMMVNDNHVRMLSAWRGSASFTDAVVISYSLGVIALAPLLVGRDWRHKAHAALAQAPLARRSYVWGRFLAVLGATLILAVLLLVSFLVVGWWMDGELLASAPAAQRAAFPAPNLVAIVVGWALHVIPLTVLLSGLGFALTMLWPRRGAAVILSLILLWIVTLVPVKYLAMERWSPQGANVGERQYLDYRVRFERAIETITAPDRQLVGSQEQAAQERPSSEVGVGLQPLDELPVLRRLEQEWPKLSPWVWPRLLHLVLGLLAVAMAAPLVRLPGADA